MTHWFRPDRSPVIPCGEPGSPDSGGARPWGGLIELPDGYWATMYRGHVGCTTTAPRIPRYRTARGCCSSRAGSRNRFCGVEAEMEGRFTIPTVKRSRDALRLNYRCAPGGHILAELIRTVPSRIHPDADPIPGFSFADCDLLSGDHLDRPVSWRGSTDLSAAGDQIAVRLKLFPGHGVRVFGLSHACHHHPCDPFCVIRRCPRPIPGALRFDPTLISERRQRSRALLRTLVDRTSPQHL